MTPIENFFGNFTIINIEIKLWLERVKINLWIKRVCPIEGTKILGKKFPQVYPIAI